MTIRFRCECGKVLLASDDQSGMEGQCPACGEVIAVPQAGVLDEEEPKQSFSTDEFDEEEMGAKQMDEEGTPEETSGEIRGLEELERDLEEEPEIHHEKGSWLRSSRFVILASALVVVIVALVVLMVVRKGRETREEVVVIEKVQPLVETEEEASSPPVGARLEEEQPVEVQEPEPTASAIDEEEPVEQVPVEPPLEEEAEAVTEEGKQEVAAIPDAEVPPAKGIPPAGAYTVNLASFKERQRADRYVKKMKEKGIEAFNWEVDLPQKGKWYRVSVGGFSTREEAENYAIVLRQKGISETFITRIPGTS